MKAPSNMSAPTPDESRVRSAFSEAALTPVYELNEFFLETLTHCARHASWQGSTWANALGQELSQLTQPVRERVARAPVCLVDVGFQDAAGWETGEGRSERAAPPTCPFLAIDRAVELAQMTVTLAWTMARTDVAAACIVFGMTGRCSKTISALGVHRLPALAQRHAPWIRPLWLNQPRIWLQLLSVSDPAPASRLPPAPVRVLQRQFADLVLATSASQPTREPRR
jgi:hypothetical protein